MQQVRRPLVKVGGPRSHGWKDMANKTLIPLQSLISCFLEPTQTGGQQWAQFRHSGEATLWYVPKALSAVTQAGGGSSVLTLLCAKNQANENCEHRSGIQQIFQQAMKGIPWHVFLSAFSSCPSALSQDSSPAKTNKAQALMSHCKNSLRDKAIRCGFVSIQREATLQGGSLPRARAWAMGCGLARFC